MVLACFFIFIKLLKQVNIIWWSKIDLFEIIPDTDVSSKLFENMLSMIVAVSKTFKRPDRHDRPILNPCCVLFKQLFF